LVDSIVPSIYPAFPFVLAGHPLVARQGRGQVRQGPVKAGL